MKIATALAIGLLALASLPSMARGASDLRMGGEVFGACDSHAMVFWNEDLELANAAGGRFNAIHRDLTGGIAARVTLTQRWRFRMAWEALRLDSKDDATGRRLNFDGDALMLDAAYLFPTTRRIGYGLSAGVGHYALHGYRANAGRKNADLSGSTWGGQVQALAEWSIESPLTLAGALGYRVARLADTRVDGRSLDPKVETDYSGPMLRIGLAFDLRVR